MEKEKEIKIITLGASGVGKTSIIKRIVDGNFNMFENSTLGFAFNRKTIKYEKKCEINIKFC